jgi:hypothetical protein
VPFVSKIIRFYFITRLLSQKYFLNFNTKFELHTKVQGLDSALTAMPLCVIEGLTINILVYQHSVYYCYFCQFSSEMLYYFYYYYDLQPITLH